MKVLVTGTATMLGAPLVRSFADHRMEVYGLYRSRNARLEGLEVERVGGLSLIQADLAGDDLAALPRRIDAVIHLAGTSPQASVAVDHMTRDNVIATLNLLQWALRAGAGRFVFFSTMSVYGRVTAPIVDSKTELRDPDAYGLSKRLGEMLCEQHSAAMPTVALRIPAMLGKGAHRHWLAGVLANAKAGRTLRIFNPDAPFNNAVHVDDLLPFLRGLLSHQLDGFAALPIGAADCLPVQDVVKRIAAGCGGLSAIEVMDSNQSSFRIDSTEAKERLGYTPSSMATIIDRYIAENA
jgi:nucleoside-diphosphate-sugar epimerase